MVKSMHGSLLQANKTKAGMRVREKAAGIVYVSTFCTVFAGQRPFYPAVKSSSSPENT
jgi:hypothetical protein